MTFIRVRSYFIHVGCFLGLSSILGSFFAFVLDWGKLKQVGYHSDTLHPFLLLADLFQGGTFATWTNGNALFAFPDWVIAAIPVGMGAPGPWQPIIYAGLIFAIVSYAAASIIRQVSKISFVEALASFLIVFFVFGFLIVARPSSPIGPTTFSHLSAVGFAFLGSPYAHGGAAAMTLVATTFLLREIAGQQGMGLAVIAIICALTTFSDPLFAIFFSAPAVVLACILWASQGFSHGPLILTTISASTLGGFICEFPSIKEGRAIYLGAGNSFFSSAKLAANLVGNAIARGDMGACLLFVLVVWILVAACATIPRVLRRKPLSLGDVLTLFLAGSICSSVLAPIASGRDFSTGEVRYFPVIFLLAILWGGLKIIELRIARSWSRWKIPGAATVASLPILVFGAQCVVAMTRPDEVVGCLLKHGRNAGFGDYWNSKSTLLTGDGALHVVAITNEGTPFYWFTNSAWTNARLDNHERPKYDFILIDRLREDTIEREFGAPSEKVNCGETTAWLYDHELTLATTAKATNVVAPPDPTFWRPVLKFGDEASGITYTAQKGTLVMAGKVAMATFHISLTSRGFSKGAATIGGFPAGTEPGLTVSGYCSYYTGMNLGSPPLGGYLSGSTFNLQSGGTAQSGTPTHENFTDASEMICSVAYPAYQ